MLMRLKNQKGFTLVELMVVLLIIGILIAVAIPVFLGTRSRAQDNAIKQALTNAGRAAAAEHASTAAWPAAGTMSAVEGAYTYSAVEVIGTGSNYEGTLGYSNDTALDTMQLDGASQSTKSFRITGDTNGELGSIVEF